MGEVIDTFIDNVRLEKADIWQVHLELLVWAFLGWVRVHGGAINLDLIIAVVGFVFITLIFWLFCFQDWLWFSLWGELEVNLLVSRSTFIHLKVSKGRLQFVVIAYSSKLTLASFRVHFLIFRYQWCLLLLLNLLIYYALSLHKRRNLWVQYLQVHKCIDIDQRGTLWQGLFREQTWRGRLLQECLLLQRGNRRVKTLAWGLLGQS